jgi:hypothetical protein
MIHQSEMVDDGSHNYKSLTDASGDAFGSLKRFLVENKSTIKFTQNFDLVTYSMELNGSVSLWQACKWKVLSRQARDSSAYRRGYRCFGALLVSMQ